MFYTSRPFHKQNAFTQALFSLFLPKRCFLQKRYFHTSAAFTHALFYTGTAFAQALLFTQALSHSKAFGPLGPLNPQPSGRRITPKAV